MLNVDEFVQLTSQDVPRVEVCNRLMQRLVEATGADAAVLWNCAQTRFRPVSQHVVEPTFQLKMSEADHSRMLSQVIANRRSILLRPEQPAANSGHSTLSENKPPMILLAPLENPSYEVIELIVPAGDDIAADNELMSTLQQAAEIASLKDESAKTLRQIDVPGLSKFVQAIHSSLNRKTTCSNIANETRLLLDCDRVVVATKERGSFRIASISGQPSINRRSNTVRLLEKLARLTLKTQREFWYPTEEELPRQLQAVIDEYLAVSPTRSLVIMPILRKSIRSSKIQSRTIVLTTGLSEA